MAEEKANFWYKAGVGATLLSAIATGVIAVVGQQGLGVFWQKPAEASQEAIPDQTAGPDPVVNDRSGQESEAEGEGARPVRPSPVSQPEPQKPPQARPAPPAPAQQQKTPVVKEPVAKEAVVKETVVKESGVKEPVAASPAPSASTQIQMAQIGGYNLRSTGSGDSGASSGVFRANEGVVIMKTPPGSALELQDIALGRCDGPHLGFEQASQLLRDALAGKPACLKVWRKGSGVLQVRV